MKLFYSMRYSRKENTSKKITIVIIYRKEDTFLFLKMTAEIIDLRFHLRITTSYNITITKALFFSLTLMSSLPSETHEEWLQPLKTTFYSRDRIPFDKKIILFFYLPSGYTFRTVFFLATNQSCSHETQRYSSSTFYILLIILNLWWVVDGCFLLCKNQ